MLCTLGLISLASVGVVSQSELGEEDLELHSAMLFIRCTYIRSDSQKIFRDVDPGCDRYQQALATHIDAHDFGPVHIYTFFGQNTF